jgi:chaperonin GroEL
VANTVKVTLGPKGRTVFIQKINEDHHATKDGVTVAKNIFPVDDVEAMGAEAIKQAAQQAAKQAGDGTTTATILCQAIAKDGIAEVDGSKRNPTAIKKGMDQAVIEIVSALKEQSTPLNGDLDLLEKIATISANNDESIGAMIREAYEKVSINGMVAMGLSPTFKNQLKTYLGVSFDSGLLSEEFMRDKQRRMSEIASPLIVVSDIIARGKVDEVGVMDLIDIAHQDAIDQWEEQNNRDATDAEKQKAIQPRPLVLIVSDIDDQNMMFIRANRQRKGLSPIDITILIAPSSGDVRKETLKDIAAVTGAVAVFESEGRTLGRITREEMGTCGNMVITTEKSMIFDGAGTKEVIDKRIEDLKGQLANADPKDENQLKERLAKLQGGVAVIHVGAPTQVELSEKVYRVEDAILATRAAISEGVVTGGAIPFYNIYQKLYELPEDLNAMTDFQIGRHIVIKALLVPIKQLIENCGEDVDSILNQLRIDQTSPEIGYNAKTGKIENLRESGIIDPTKVPRIALENAVSVAGTIITTEATITEIKN